MVVLVGVRGAVVVGNKSRRHWAQWYIHIYIYLFGAAYSLSELFIWTFYLLKTTPLVSEERTPAVDVVAGHPHSRAVRLARKKALLYS